MHSCANDEYSTSDFGGVGKAHISLKLPSIQNVGEIRDGEDKETRIVDLSLFVFDSTTGEKQFFVRLDMPYSGNSNDVDMTRWASDKVITILNSKVLTNLAQKCNIHVVANIELNKLNAIDTEADLKSVIVNNQYQSNQSVVDKALLMHGAITDHKFSNTPLATISLVRNVSKIKLNINSHNFNFGGANVVLVPAGQKLGFTLHQATNSSFLVSTGSNPSKVSYLSYPTQKIAPQSSGTSSVAKAEAYLLENLRTTYDPEENVTYAILQVPYQIEGRAEINQNNYYKILINQENGFKINRNTIYDITLDISSLGGDTEATAPLLSGELNILPWDEKTIISDISQTYLTVKETMKEMTINSDFYFATNANVDKRSVEVADTWLTASFDAANENSIRLVASAQDYTSPRSTTMKIKVNNLVKVITINQKAVPVADGSISLAPKQIYISEVSPTAKSTLSVTPNNSTWLQLAGNSSVASASASKGTGNKTIEYKRGTSYENTYYQYVNLSTLHYDSVKVCNLYLSTSSEEIGVPGEGGTFTETDLLAKGGDAQWVVKSKSNWITSAANVNGELKYTVLAEPNELDRSGVITIAHVNDLNYTKDIHINQSAKYIRFPDYDYLVVRFLFATGVDLDTATELANTGVTGLEKLPVGWRMGTSQGEARKYKNYDFIEWAGDNQREGYEATFVNMYNLCHPSYGIYDDLPRYFNIDLYACWYTSGVAPKPMDMEITLYKGGKMNRVRTFDYENVGGTQVHQQIYKNINIPTQTNKSNLDNFMNGFRQNYTSLGTIRYDKFKNTATMTLGTNSSSNSVRSSRSAFPMSATKAVSVEYIQGESKDEYAKRYNAAQK